ncbi:hypothetical protein C8J55DRAFT_99109 [Lentinula edodes]|uniref:Uncharacterized protein n=1 Tax=Lentinula lateritia TaxID=40482 RepID=A0A9W9AZW5_9AGAR|nr:hypothetical protein C8J55DRAFT_99109 [Lentinula edodes]
MIRRINRIWLFPDLLHIQLFLRPQFFTLYFTAGRCCSFPPRSLLCCIKPPSKTVSLLRLHSSLLAENFHKPNPNMLISATKFYSLLILGLLSTALAMAAPLGPSAVDSSDTGVTNLSSLRPRASLTFKAKVKFDSPYPIIGTSNEDKTQKMKIKNAVKLLIKAALDPSGSMRLTVSDWGQIAPNAVGNEQQFTVEVNFTPELPPTTSGLRIKPQTATKHYAGWVSWKNAPKVSGELCDEHTTLKVENSNLIGAFPNTGQGLTCIHM